MTNRKKIVVSFLTAAISVILVLLIIYNLPESTRRLQSQHFTFIFNKHIDTAEVVRLRDTLENNYARIADELQTVPADHINTHIYAARWRYTKATGNWGASGSIEGVSNLHFVESTWSEADHAKVALHEFTHAVVLKRLIDQENQPLDAKAFDLKFSSYPVWLWEAIGCYEARQLADIKSLPYLQGGHYPRLSELNERSMGGKIYQVGYTIIEFILQKFGKARFLQLVSAYGNIPAVLQIPDEEFTREWYLYVKERYLN